MVYNEIYLIILIVFSWIFIILYLSPHINKTRHFSTMGPALMIKSTHNRGILDAISKHFPGKTFGKISDVLVVLGGLTAFIMLLYEAILLTIVHVPTSEAPPLNEYLAIPLINPLIPLGYGTASLVFAVVIHETFHGIVARKHGIKVSSVGALFFVIPVGAFVEPDEKEIMDADPVIRRRIIAAGPGINIVIAFIALMLLIFVMMPLAPPVHSGVYIQESENAQIPHGYEIIKYGNISGSALNNLETDSYLKPGMENIVLYNGTTVNKSVLTGVFISQIISGFPAAAAHVPSDSVILSINGSTIYNINTLGNVLDKIKPGTNITMEIMTLNGKTDNYTLKTVSTYSYYEKDDPAANKNIYKNESFIGVGITYSGLDYIPLKEMRGLIFGSALFGPQFFDVLGLPVLGLSPVPYNLAHLFSTPFNNYIYFGLVNSLYWLFWIDFLLGIMNALPVAVFDGGQFFRDTLMIASRRERFSFLKNEKTLTKIYYGLALFIIMLLFYIIIIPRVI
ncbi:MULTISPECIES: site-2 protease family protein [Acidiplasma]|jgi:membrane-associated protease RseP (regulator of RpoE activity)|uniref:Peptidase n=3 Tax=Acidiplasma TaxID=507753 RepID=A0A0Q0WHK9_9ARCH|nr:MULTISPECIES: site-2 protease family protein [Acidiplasma]KJE49351.1 peptidase [Acidiplasma sp. MBA-1]KQB34272.1 peptidase [Acidiplasma aeolicum]KQB35001.1 peptidase [Acidiplasma cupricumulans]WMT54707.1 MAG: site-2 protease family protein [Acidiplasma sp.]